MLALQVVAVVLAVGATAVGVTAFAGALRGIVRTVRRGGPAPDRRSRPVARTVRVLVEVLGHTRFRNRPWVAVAHWVVMVSFVVLVLSLVAAYAQLVDPTFVLPLLGRWVPFAWLTELVAWGGLLGIVVLAVARQVTHPRRTGRDSRFFGSNHRQAYLVEATIAVVVVAVLVLRGLEHALTGADHLFPTTAWLGSLLAGASREALEAAVVVVALVKILASTGWMYVVGRRPAMGVAWHRFLAFVNVWARRDPDGSPALGPLAPLRGPDGTAVDLTDLEELDEDARLGVGRVEDLTWKGLLDVSTCTECGRCQEQCPAWNTGKPLSPKLVVLALRDHAYATSPGLVPAPNASTEPGGHTATTGHAPLPLTDLSERGESMDPPRSDSSHEGMDVLSLVGDVVDTEALWDCTTCGACVQQCPVDIEHVDHIVDMRRNQVLMESAFPAELGKVFRGLERQGNPWGSPARRRLAWADGLDVPVVGQDVEDLAEVDWLFWVGCAGAYDDRARQTSVAVVELLRAADVSFAVLEGEQCTGDPARRAGNEMLYQMLASANVEALDAAGARRIVVTCAHCFNTIAREYPQLGGRYEVVHHTELLAQLVAEGRLTPVAGDGTITYHDPCYLGRHNQVYSPPRELLGSVATVVEMPRSGERSFCCGGGGARVWMEERTGRRIADERVAEARGTGAGTVATACPWCTTMLSGAKDAPEVVDAAVLLQRALPGRTSDGGGAGADE